MSKDRKELRELAKSQPVSNWAPLQGAESLTTSRRIWHIDGPKCIGCFEDWGFDENSARYIAAADPATVLALLDELEAAKPITRTPWLTCRASAPSVTGLRDGLPNSKSPSAGMTNATGESGSQNG